MVHGASNSGPLKRVAQLRYREKRRWLGSDSDAIHAVVDLVEDLGSESYFYTSGPVAMRCP